MFIWYVGSLVLKKYLILIVKAGFTSVKKIFNKWWASLIAQLVKNLPAMQETWIWFLDWEDPMEKGKATHSKILTWRIPWTV